jgi:hypothetical protein
MYAELARALYRDAGEEHVEAQSVEEGVCAFSGNAGIAGFEPS